MAQGLTRRRAVGMAGVWGLTGRAGCTGGPEPATAAADPHPAEQLEFSVTDTRPVGEDRPGAVTLALINSGATPVTVLYRRGLEVPFSSIQGQQADGDGDMVLFPIEASAYRAIPCEGAADSPVPATRSDGCWAVDCAIRTPFDAVGLHEIDAGQRFTVTSAVLATGPPPCLPPGTYRFSESGPAAVGGGMSMSDPTYPRQLFHQLEKRLTISLAADGMLRASAELERPAVDTESD